MLRRYYSTTLPYQELRNIIRSKIPAKRALYQQLKTTNSNVKIGDLTVGATIGGMRGYESLIWEASKVDPEKGVRFHGRTIEECQKLLPKVQGGSPKDEFLPESMFWFLITGEIPTQKQINGFVAELNSNLELPQYLNRVIDALPKSMHPMTQLAIAVSAMNNDSKFAKAYEGGIAKDKYWELYFDDSLNLISKMPAIVGRIYSNTYHNGEVLGKLNPSKDWSYNLSSLLGQTYRDSKNINNLTNEQSDDFVNLMRLYLALHGDHEGGNVSAHASHLVGSALSDSYLSLSAGIQGLAGPLHGLAAQEVVKFIVEMKSKVHDINDKAEVEKYLWSLLNSKRVIPGYGHGVLRKPDPRFDAMIKFGLNRPEEFKNDEYFQLVKNLSEIAPTVLKEHGKTKNPFPNVDSSSGILFYHYGMKELLFFTVIFGASRSLGPLAQLVWDRALGMPIERPKSVTLEGLSHLH